MAAKKKKTRVPEILWRLFGNSARTLADTILALIPPSPERENACHCSGKLCLGCCGDESMPFLVRPEDPTDYYKLLTRCYVVVSQVPHPPPHFDLRSFWPHREMVRRIVELMLYNQPSTSNLICSNYDRGNRLSFVFDELTSSKWSLLLSRIGDGLMIYLLEHTSIFLPLPREKHLQITGDPIANLLSKLPVPMPRNKVKLKRKRVNGDELPRKQPRVDSMDYEPISNSLNCSTSNGSNVTNMPKKLRREFRWERQRKRMAYQWMPSCNIANCFCCSVFQNEPRMKGNAETVKRNIFFKMENCSSILPKTHMLYTLNPNFSGASLLFNNIFGANGTEENARSVRCCHKENGSRFTCLYHRLMELLKILLRNIRNCKHRRLLEKHCPTRFSSQDSTTGAGNASEVAMTKNGTTIPETSTAPVESITYCLNRQIVSFIWAICRRIVPQPLLGEPSSWRSLRGNISKFIELRRFEKFSLKECLYRLKISKFPIFSMQIGCNGQGVTDSARRAIFERWIIWFFTHLVSPLVETNFYMTDSQHKRQEVLFYKKSDWKTLMKQDKYVPPRRYCKLTYDQARGLLGGRSFGFSRARLHPKNKGGLRLLANLQAPSRFLGPSRCSKSVNNVLNEVHLVLRSLHANEPEKLGATVFGYNDVYKKLVPFLSKLRNGLCNIPDVFLMVSDVSNAFDSIGHEKLLRVMKDVVCSDEFTLQTFTQVICIRKSLRIDRQPMLPREDIVAASARVRSRYHGQSLGGIALKKELIKKVRNAKIHSLLREHITGNVVQLGKTLYLQRVGIPQGSVLSTLLCSFYYGHMERNIIFPFLEESKEDLLANDLSPCGTSASGGIQAPSCEYLLLRFLDDFLFISTSKKQASKFFNLLDEGVHDYNCTMNKEKYGVNFSMEDRQVCQSNNLHIDRHNTSFLQWSGLLVNCSTLEIQADYTRYLNCHLRSTLTVRRQGKVGKILRDKLKSYLRPKCHPLFYASNINSPRVVRLNIYQAFMLSAMKFFCHLSNLSILPRFTPKFCLDAIMASLSYMNRLIKKRMHSFRVDSAFRPKYDVRKEDVIWLGICAYIRVLKKKQSRYKTLLCMLRSLLKKDYGEIENMSPELRYAIDDVHSYALLGIRF